MIAYRRFQECTAALEPVVLQNAYRSCWAWGTEMMACLRQWYELAMLADLFREIDRLQGG